MSLENAVKKLDENLIRQKSEMGEVMDNLDSDTVDTDTLMSKIDFNARLTDTEISSVLIIDEFQRLGIFPKEAGITRQKKRLSVSKNGLGRQEKVQIVQGERDAKMGMGGKIANLFKRQP